MFPCKFGDYAVCHDKDKGPSFGIHEFYSEQPFNGENKCACATTYNFYDIPYNYNPKDTDRRFINMLTNVGYKEFSDPFTCTIEELEVWKVKFIE